MGEAIGDRPSDHEDDADDEPVVDEHPTYFEPKDGHVHVWRHDKYDDAGRISVIRPGEPSEALSVYCRLHGCMISKRILQAPDTQDIFKWYEQGYGIPKGRTPALQTRHKAVFPELAPPG